MGNEETGRERETEACTVMTVITDTHGRMESQSD